MKRYVMYLLIFLFYYWWHRWEKVEQFVLLFIFNSVMKYIIVEEYEAMEGVERNSI